MQKKPHSEETLCEVARLEESWSGAPWSAAALASFLSQTGTELLVCREDGRLLGYLAFRTAADEAEIVTVFVCPEARRRGIGRALLDEVTHTLPPQTRIFLEVRVSNRAARALYEAAGYKAVGTRPNFYTSPREDAVLYRREGQETDLEYTCH